MTTTRNFEIEVDSLLLCQKLPLHSNLGCFPNQKTVIQKFYQNQTKKQKKKQTTTKIQQQERSKTTRFAWLQV